MPGYSSRAGNWEQNGAWTMSALNLPVRVITQGIFWIAPKVQTGTPTPGTLLPVYRFRISVSFHGMHNKENTCQNPERPEDKAENDANDPCGS